MTNKNKIYYAHHLQKYNTIFEDYELGLIKKAFPNTIIVNPNGDIKQAGTNDEIMQECLNVLQGCDIVVFSTVCGNCIGKGVFQEIERAVDEGIPVFYIYGNEVKSAKDIQLKKINGNSGRFYAKVIGLE